MKKTYETPDIEMLDFTETACHAKAIYASNGDIVGYECDSHGANCNILNLNNGQYGNNSGHGNNNGWGNFWYRFFGWH